MDVAADLTLSRIVLQVATSMLDSHNHSEAVGHLELATGKSQPSTFGHRTVRSTRCSVYSANVFRKFLLLAPLHKACFYDSH